MAYKPALKEGEMHRLNLKAILTWIEGHKGKIKAKPNKSVFYAGRDYDLEVVKDLSLEDREEFMGTPMWKRLEQTKKQMHDLKVPCGFQTLEDVLKSIREYPKIVDKDHIEQRCSNAFEFFNEIESNAKLLPDAKSVSRVCWEKLSQIYASNATGDIQILDGAADDYGKLREDKILIRKELEALLRNPKLSKEGKALLQKKIGKYGDHFDRRYTELIHLLVAEKKCLKRR